MKLHFIGIGGIGVSALAQYYLAKGNKISGSDLVSSEITDYLKKKGVKIHIGKTVEVRLQQADLVICSPAVLANNPELKKARKLGIKCLSYPEALGELTKKYFTIAVAGTHGKSTTTAMISLMLIKAGLNPTVILGTKLKQFGDSNFRMGGFPKSKIHAPYRPALSEKGGAGAGLNLKSKILIIEADEHFASFLNYWPKIIVLTRIEADHLDYFKNFRNYISVFKKFVSHLPRDGFLIANRDDKIIYNTFSHGRGEICYFSLRQKEAEKIREILKVPGEHNISNALAALTVARILKIPDKISFKALSEYRGSWRRFEEKSLKIKNLKFKIISDYAHHPTEIKATLIAAREKYPQKKIWCVFQPHQYQRTYYLFKDFVKVFRQAPVDKIIITGIFDVAGRENKKIKKIVNSEKLVKMIKKSNVIYLPKTRILNYLKKNARGGEVVIIMGAGDIYKLCEQCS